MLKRLKFAALTAVALGGLLLIPSVSAAPNTNPFPNTASRPCFPMARRNPDGSVRCDLGNGSFFTPAKSGPLGFDPKAALYPSHLFDR